MKGKGGPEAAIHTLQLELAESNATITRLKGDAASLRDQVQALKEKLGQGGGKVAEQVDEMTRLRRELAGANKVSQFPRFKLYSFCLHCLCLSFE